MQNPEPALPSNRAFVVQFRAAPASAPGQCAGRVEHLVSGQVNRFESWEHLQRFIEEMLMKIGEKPP